MQSLFGRLSWRRARVAILIGFSITLSLPPARLALAQPTPSAEGPATLVGENQTGVTQENADGSFTTTAYSVPVNYAASGETVEPIDTTLVPVPGPDPDSHAASNSFDIQLPPNIADPVQVSDGGGSVGLTLLGAEADGATAGDSITYTDALPGTTVIYTAENDSLKEAIRLDNLAASRTFLFALDPGGLTPIQTAGGDINLLDAAGATRFVLAAPFMIDNAPNSDLNPGPVSMSLSLPQAGYRIQMTPDAGWLGDPDRQWPVTIDPSIVIPAPSRDCWMQSGTSGASQSCVSSTLNVGVNSNGTRRALLNFSLDSVPIEATVSSATLGLTLTSDSNTKLETLEADPLTQEWNSSVTWSTYDGTSAWNTAGGDYTTPASTLAGVGGTVTTPVAYSFDVTQVAQAWVNGSLAQNGVIVRQANDATATTGNILSFASSEHANSAYWPTLSVTYSLDYPTGGSLTATPTSVYPGGTVSFSAGWSAPGHQAQLLVCASDSAAEGQCPGGEWAGGQLGSSTPATATYTASSDFVGTQTYYAYVCTAEGLCSREGAGTFTIQPAPAGPQVPAGLSPQNGANSTNTSPILSGVFGDSVAGSSGFVRFHILDTQRNLLASGNGNSVSPSGTSTWTVPSGILQAGNTYLWTAQSTDGIASSEWSADQTYVATATAPDAPDEPTPDQWLASPSSYPTLSVQDQTIYQPTNDLSSGMGFDGTSAAPSGLGSSDPSAIPVPAISNSYYVRYLSEWQHYRTTIYNFGTWQPAKANIVGILDVGSPCSATGLTLYSNQCIDVGDISLRAMQWLQGYYDNSNHHYKDSTTTYVITLVIGINNNTTQDSTNLTNNAKNLYNKIVDTLYEYAAVLNSFASTNHYHFEFQIAGGDDIEQAFGPPSSAKPWVNGWGVAYTASNVKMALINFGGWLATCHDKVCFPKPIATANGWAPSDAYDVSFASGVRFPFPQVPNANRGTFWHDLDLAAQDAGKTKMLFWGVWWGCTESTVKAEPSPSQAYRDFAGRVKQKPLYLTRGHALNRQAEVCES